jgi:hypothetical protein
MKLEPDLDLHFIYSTLRERIVEHVFVGDVLRRLWQIGITDVEVLRSEFDSGGYDLVLSYRSIVRHIQFKTMRTGGKADSVKVGLKLMEKPSGCVIWIVVDPNLNLQSFLWFGGTPGEPLPDIFSMRIAKHTKGTSTGVKNERVQHRIIRRSQFDKLTSLDELLSRLFGHLPPND